jgi:nickel/cobalt transporter (NicO) family protein
MMSTDLTILIVTAASIGFLHTLTGPDHYLPFIVMSKARSWNTAKTLWITFLCGLGHVGSSIVIGTIGIVLGLGVKKLEVFESFRGNLAALAFIAFGFIYFLWGLWKALKDKPHKHVHLHNNGSIHVHEHQHTEILTHSHNHNRNIPVNITPWILFTIFVLGPCEPLIPLLMYPAAKIHVGAIIIVAVIFSIVTISTMMVIVVLTMRGINFLPMKVFEKYMHAFAGAAICLSGCAIVFLGL